MTAMVTDPRPGQISELVDVLRDRDRQPEYAPYFDGYVIGFWAALLDDPTLRDELLAARAANFAHAFSLHEAIAMPWGKQILGNDEDRRRRYLRQCGVLFGWKMATAERPDAEECTACQDRILIDADDPSTCTPCVWHGWFCSPDCQRVVCRASCERGDD